MPSPAANARIMRMGCAPCSSGSRRSRRPLPLELPIGLGPNAGTSLARPSVSPSAARRRRSSSPGRRRAALRSLWRRLASSRRTLAARVGRVGTRVGSTRRASARRDPSRARASSRLRTCDRESAAPARTTGPSRSSSRARWRGPSDGDPTTSKRASTRVWARLACWPPGPPLVEVRSSTSSSGITSDRETRSTSAGPARATGAASSSLGPVSSPRPPGDRRRRPARPAGPPTPRSLRR